MSELDKVKKYFDIIDLKGENFLDRYWIKSNKYYIFIVDGLTLDKVYIMFSKKYYITIELTKNKKHEELLNVFSELADSFREELGVEVEKYEFWLPHCKVNGNLVNSQFIAESYGISRDSALDYLCQYDEGFKTLYNVKKKEYFGLPLFATLEEANNYVLKDNTKKYIKGLKLVEKLKKGE